MSYCGYVCTLKNVRPHPNADRLQLADVSCGGNTVCVDLTYTENQLCVYFPTDGQLSEEFCQINDLVRRKDENGNYAGGYLEPNKRNIRSIMLRGQQSDGLVLPLSAFEYTKAKLALGDTVTILNGHEICQKYIPRKNAPKTVAGGAGKRVKRRAKRSIAPTFFEHADTEQLAYNMNAFKPGDEVEITLKMHGTSQRTGYQKIISGYAGPKIALDILGRKGIFRWITPSEKMFDWADGAVTPLYDWGYVTGTRRTVLEDFDKPSFYDTNNFREGPANAFRDKLWKGETVYYEVVGFQDNGAPIMASVPNSRVQDKAFTKQYGKETVFSYGCSLTDENLPKTDFYVYRMTMVNEDGDVVEYTPDFMRYRCDQMGVKTVMSFWKGTIPENPINTEVKTIPQSFGEPDIIAREFSITPGEYIKNIAEEFYDGPDPIGKTHIREGVVCRILNRPNFTAYKHKNFFFKVIEGICKDEATAPDIEEAEEEFKDEEV